MGPLSKLSNLSTWCQVISKIQKGQKSTETTLGRGYSPVKLKTEQGIQYHTGQKTVFPSDKI
jgi:hypothetical protein